MEIVKHKETGHRGLFIDVSVNTSFWIVSLFNSALHINRNKDEFVTLTGLDALIPDGFMGHKGTVLVDDNGRERKVIAVHSNYVVLCNLEGAATGVFTYSEIQEMYELKDNEPLTLENAKYVRIKTFAKRPKDWVDDMDWLMGKVLPVGHIEHDRGKVIPDNSKYTAKMITWTYRIDQVIPSTEAEYHECWKGYRDLPDKPIEITAENFTEYWDKEVWGTDYKKEFVPGTLEGFGKNRECPILTDRGYWIHAYVTDPTEYIKAGGRL